MENFKSIVALSYGKDSVATLLKVLEEGWKPEIVFCDTGWESPELYAYAAYLNRELDIKVKTLKSNKYADFVDMVIQKKRFPSTKSRFCTSALKVEPMIDYLLDDVNGHFIVFQGIRADESSDRSKMNKVCTYFKYYFEPYGYDIKGKAKFHTYRKQDVFEFAKKYTHDVQRPVFDYSAENVFELIKSKGIEPNPLYKKGHKRVGCYPCINSNHMDIWNIYNRDPERIQMMIDLENGIGTTFFPPEYVPIRYATKTVKVPINQKKWEKYSEEEKDFLREKYQFDGNGYQEVRIEMKVNTTHDVIRYLTDKHKTGDLFADPQIDKFSCSSFYNLCE